MDRGSLPIWMSKSKPFLQASRNLCALSSNGEPLRGMGSKPQARVAIEEERM
jgi:hypothetical protein